MPKKIPTLSAPDTVDVLTSFPVTGKDFPKKTSVFVIVNRVAPPFGREPSVLTETDAKGNLAVAAKVSVVGTYELTACIHTKQRGGRWDCRSVEPEEVEAT